MKVLFDTNVILDVLLNRQPHVQTASLLFARVERKELTGYVCATTITTIFYLASESVGVSMARLHINSLLSIFKVAVVDSVVLQKALISGFSDFEDAVLYESAAYAGVDYLVTRNIKDFKLAQLPVYLPDELEAIIRVK